MTASRVPPMVFMMPITLVCSATRGHRDGNQQAGQKKRNDRQQAHEAQDTIADALCWNALHERGIEDRHMLPLENSGNGTRCLIGFSLVIQLDFNLVCG